MLGDPASPLLWSINGDQPDERSLLIWCTYTGQNEEAALNWGWLNALHPNDRENIRATWKQITLTRRPTTLVCQIYHFRQGYLPFKILTVPVFNVERQLENWFLFFFKDATSPSPAPENGEIKRMYSMIFTQNILGVFSLSLDGNILQVNERFCQLLGYSEAELLAMTLWQLGWSESVQAHADAIRDSLASGENPQPFRTRYKRKDDTSTWVRVAQFLVRHSTGEPRYFFFTIEDVNAQVQVEAERAELIARSQEAHQEALNRTLQLEAVFDAISEGILVSDRAGRIIQSNAAVKRLLHLENDPDFLQLPLSERLARLKALDENGQELTLEQWPLTRVLRGETLFASREGD